MKKILTVLLITTVFGSCVSKKKTVSSGEQHLSQRIDTVTESIRKEMRNPEALLLLGDRVTRNGEYFQPIDRVLRVSENRGQLRFSMDSLGAVTVSYTVPPDTVSIVHTNEKKKVKESFSENRSEKTKTCTAVPFGWILVPVLILMFILYRALKKFTIL